jgi:SAM-dependent methyltransferase
MLAFQNWQSELDRPAPYQSGAPLWTHPHIAGEMLKAHLDPETDAASYRPESIRAICEHLQTAMGWTTQSQIVDLGCGPGLYCHAIATAGAAVTGIDQSANSLRYARALCHDQKAHFVKASYLEPFGENAFDAALLISQDYGVLSPSQRQTLLGNIRLALKPGGRFALDVPSLAAYAERSGQPTTEWETSQGDFWRPRPYLLLHTIHLYPEINTLCDLYAVMDSKVTVYRVWQTCFTPESITRELVEAGFRIEQTCSDLQGTPWTETSGVIGILCQKA